MGVRKQCALVHRVGCVNTVLVQKLSRTIAHNAGGSGVRVFAPVHPDTRLSDARWQTAQTLQHNIKGGLIGRPLSDSPRNAALHSLEHRPPPWICLQDRESGAC